MDSIYTFLKNQESTFVFPEAVRKKALVAYEEIPVPVKKLEDWKYTDVSSLFSSEYEVAKSLTEVAEGIISLDAYKLVFLNGAYSAHLSNLPESVTISDIAEAGSELQSYIEKSYNTDTKFSAINTAYATEGKLFYIGKSKVVDKPIHIEYINSSAVACFFNTKNIIVADENSVVEFVESHSSFNENKVVSNIVTNIFVGKNANVKISLLEFETGSKQINSIYVSQEASSCFTAQTLQLEGDLVRNNIIVDHAGEHCETNLNGIFFPKENQLFDNFTLVNHNTEDCKTSENYKGVAKDAGTGIFVGKVYVARGAQKTIAEQSNKNILLSDNAKIHSKPQLEIYADDVSCAHGSTTGQIDRDALFYCQARGISKTDAMRLLLQAFLSENLEKIKHQSIADYVETYIQKHLS